MWRPCTYMVKRDEGKATPSNEYIICFKFFDFFAYQVIKKIDDNIREDLVHNSLLVKQMFQLSREVRIP